MTRITKQRIRDVLGDAPKPTTVWQKQFDGFDETLVLMAQTDWDEIHEDDLWEYFHDLTYQDLQPDLFRHVFPACLKFWYETLMRNEGAERGDADFHRALIRGNILEKMMTTTERQRTLDFFADAFLERIDLERGFEYEKNAANAWIFRFNSIGLVAPIIPSIWSAWWSVETPGRAVSAIRYATGLVYLKGENPIYRAWTREEGGGGPYLTEWDSSYYDGGWLKSNLQFLKNTLTVDYVVERLALASAKLSNESEGPQASSIAKDAINRKDVIQLRIDDLIENLEKNQLEQDFWD